jgi:hypothetical protein
MGLIQNLKSGIIRGEVEKSLTKLNPSLIVPALDNILESICLIEKDQKEVKQMIKNKLMSLIRALN